MAKKLNKRKLLMLKANLHKTILTICLQVSLTPL